MQVVPGNISLDSTTREVALEPSVFYNNGNADVSYILKDTINGIRYQSATGKAAINGQGVVQAITPGLDTISVMYNNQTVKVPVNIDANFALAAKQASTIQFDVTNKTVNYPPFALTGKSTSGEPVNYVVISGPVTLQNNMVTITGTGSVTIRASAPANAYYSAAPPVDKTFLIITGTSTYTFTGNGNWDNPSNWSNNIIPPANLPDGSSIVISPAGAGECILNITQSISKNAVFNIAPGARFRVLGGLKINKIE